MLTALTPLDRFLHLRLQLNFIFWISFLHNQIFFFYTKPLFSVKLTYFNFTAIFLSILKMYSINFTSHRKISASSKLITFIITYFQFASKIDMLNVSQMTHDPFMWTAIMIDIYPIRNINIIIKQHFFAIISLTAHKQPPGNRRIKVLLAKFPRLVFSHKWNVYSVFNFFYLFWLINYFFKSMIKITNFLTLYLSILRILRWKHLSFLTCIFFLKKSDSLYKATNEYHHLYKKIDSYRTFGINLTELSSSTFFHHNFLFFLLFCKSMFRSIHEIYSLPVEWGCPLDNGWKLAWGSQ